MWQCLGTLLMVTVGCGKLLLSSEQKLGLLPNILQGTDQPPMAINNPVHDVNCADIEKCFSVKDDFYVLWQKCIISSWERMYGSSICILPIKILRLWDVVMGPYHLTDYLSICHYLYALHYSMMWSLGLYKCPKRVQVLSICPCYSFSRLCK